MTAHPSSLPANRRQFIRQTASAALALGLGGASLRAAETVGTASAASTGTARSRKMFAGHQNDHSPATLRLLAAYGVEHICAGRPSPKLDENWSVEGLTRLRKEVESFGIRLNCVLLPMDSMRIARVEYPDILLGREPGRTEAITAICQMIRNAGEAGIGMLRYNLTYHGVVRTERVPGRGGAAYNAFDYRKTKPDGSVTEAGQLAAETVWERITYFLEQVVPVAERAGVKLALHPNDPGMPPGQPFQGIVPVLASVEGLKRFIEICPSPYHGLNFCQGTVSSMLPRPGEEIYDVIRYFGERRKIFNVHFRNIAGGYLDFRETFPDNGDVDMPRALRVYQEVGYEGMIMPDHVPTLEGDDRSRAFAFCFGYIQALLQTLPA